MRLSDRHRVLQLRVLALQNVRTGYEPHQSAIGDLLDETATRLGHDEQRVNWLTWHYRRQVSPELVPWAWAAAR